MSKLGRLSVPRRQWLLPGVAVTLFAFALLRDIEFVNRYSSPTPFWDFWNWVSDFQAFREGHYTWHDLFKPHNEHRIITTRLVLFVDALYFHMSGKFALFTNLFLLAVTGWLLGGAAAPVGLGARGRLTFGLVLASLMLSACQWQNFVFPFNIQYAWLALSITGAALLLARAGNPMLSTREAVIASSCSGALFGLGMFSMAGGILALPSLLLMALLNRTNWRSTLPFLVLASLSVLSFFAGYNPQHTLVLGTDWQQRLSLLRFALRFMGGPFYAYPLGPLVMGLIGCVLFALATATVIRESDRPVNYALLSIAGTILLSAGAAAVARVSVGEDTAIAPRYTTVALLFWCSIIPLSIRSLPRRMGEQVPVVLAATALSLACNSYRMYDRMAAGFSNLLQSQGEAMRQNVYVPELFAPTFYGTRAEAAGRIAFLKREQLSVFSPYTQPEMPGNLMRSLSRPGPLPPCQGQVEQLYRLDRVRLLLRAWLASNADKRTANWIAFRTQSGTLEAIVAATQRRDSVGRGRAKIKPALAVNTGITLRDSEASDLKAFGLFAGAPELTCKFPVTLKLGLLRVQPLETVSAAEPVRTEGEVLSDGFHDSGAPAIAPLTAPFPRESFVASGRDGDAATGTARFTFQPDAARDVIIPFASGPDTKGQALSVTFSDHTTDSMAVPDDTQVNIWRALVIPGEVTAHRGGGTITVVGADTGKDWGEWLAIGHPMIGRSDSDWAKLY